MELKHHFPKHSLNNNGGHFLLNLFFQRLHLEIKLSNRVIPPSTIISYMIKASCNPLCSDLAVPILLIITAYGLVLIPD